MLVETAMGDCHQTFNLNSKETGVQFPLPVPYALIAQLDRAFDY